MTLGCLLLAAALSAGNAEFEESAVRGAAEITVARIRAEIETVPCATGALRTAMLKDPARFATREAALREGEYVYADAAQALYRGRVDAALARLAGARTPAEAFGTNFVGSARVLTDEGMRRALAGPYAKAFERERRAACDEQARGIVSSVRPAMETVDSDDEDLVRRTLVENIAAQGGRIVFEENHDYISQKLVDPLLADAKREKERQQKYVRSVRSDAQAPSALARDLARKLAENVRERASKTENVAMRWDVFPSVTNRTLAASVERRVVSRLTDKVAEMKMDVSDAAVARHLESGAEAHRTAAASRSALHAVYAASLLSGALAADVRDAEERDRAELSSYLSARLASTTVTKAVDTRLAAELDPVLSRVRSDVAVREFAALWPTLADRTWYPAADFADDVVARSDFAAAVRNWRSLPALKTFDLKAKLEETDAKADAAVRDAFELARAAVAGQTKTVDEVKPSILAESRERKNGTLSRTPDLREIVEMLTKATSTRWTERKNAVLWPDAALPKNAAEQHAELFPSVRKRIELVAKEILEELAEPEEKKPEEPPPEETPPEETPPEEPKMEFTILVSKEGERVTVKLEQSGRDVVSRETDAKLAPFRAAMKEVADKLGAEILNLK